MTMMAIYILAGDLIVQTTPTQKSTFFSIRIVPRLRLFPMRFNFELHMCISVFFLSQKLKHTGMLTCAVRICKILPFFSI